MVKCVSEERRESKATLLCVFLKPSKKLTWHFHMYMGHFRQTVHQKGNRKSVNIGKLEFFYNVVDRKGIPVCVAACKNKNICKKLVTGLLLNIIWLMLMFLLITVLCSEILKIRRNELLYFSEFLSKIYLSSRYLKQYHQNKNDQQVFGTT